MTGKECFNENNPSINIALYRFKVLTGARQWHNGHTTGSTWEIFWICILGPPWTTQDLQTPVHTCNPGQLRLSPFRGRKKMFLKKYFHINYFH